MTDKLNVKNVAVEKDQVTQNLASNASLLISRYYGNKDVPPVIAINSGEDKCQQQFKDECDINYVVAHNSAEGVAIVCERNQKVAQYGVCDMFKSALEHADEFARTKEYFECMPSDVRKQFGNDFSLFLEQSQDKTKFDKFCDLGIYERPIKTEEVKPSLVEPPVNENDKGNA